MGLFDKKKEVSRLELRSGFRKDSGKIPGTFRKYNTRARENMAKSLFDVRKYGPNISQTDYKDKLNRLNKDKVKAKTFTERKPIEDQLKYLREFGGPQFKK